MMAFTHGVIGAVSYAGVMALAGEPPEATALAASALGALLPDVDTPSSKAGYCLYPLAFYLERKFGHRTVTHSVVGTLCFAALCAPLLLWPQTRVLFSPLLIGYISHLLADAATKSGVPLAWPHRARFVFPGHEKYRIQTGSKAEIGVLCVFLLLGWGSVSVAHHGARRLLHLALSSHTGAVRDVEDWSGDWKSEAEIEGFDVLHQKLIQERLPVIGRRGDGKLIIERQGVYWLLSETGDELYRIAPRRVRVHQIEKQTHVTRVLRVSNLTFAALSRALSQAGKGVLFTGAGECYSFSSSPQHWPQDAPERGLKTVTFSGHKVVFDFAAPKHLMASPRVALKSATLNVQIPSDAQLSPLQFPLRRRIVIADHLRRRADLLVSEGDLVRAGRVLARPFAQQYEHEPTPEEEWMQQRADAARKELEALEVEENALRKTSLWKEMRDGFAARRSTLLAQASYEPPVMKQEALPPSPRAPFDGLVESIEWEPPTIPTRKGEKPEHAARVVLVEVRQ